MDRNNQTGQCPSSVLMNPGVQGAVDRQARGKLARTSIFPIAQELESSGFPGRFNDRSRVDVV